MNQKYPRYAKEVQELLAHLANGHDNQESEPEIPPAHTAQEPQREIYVLFVREEEDEEIIDSTVSDLETTPLRPAQQHTANAGSGIVYFALFVILITLSCIMVQFYFLLNPFSVTVTLAARSQQLTVQGTLQLGRMLSPITVSQAATVNTTGKGHQDARSATGTLTFYNGQFQSVFVPAGTMLTGTDGIQVTTDADVTIPAGNPPTYGQVTVSAHASNTGARGNIAALDINQTCCAPSVFVKNTAPFQGGQDERNFQTVAKSDIDNAAAALQATVTQGSNTALQGQLKQGEHLQTLPCSPIVTSDHQPGIEATTVKVTVYETCSALAYNEQELTDKVTQLLTTQTIKKVGLGYSLLEIPRITVTAATPGKQVTLSFSSVSTWVYGISSQQQHQIKLSIAGKQTQQALQLLSSLPGIEGASLAFSGFGDASRIPKNLSTIHLMMSMPA